MDITRNNQNIPSFVGIEYPGNIQNIDKMIKTLGGIEYLSKVFSKKEILQLKFHPNNFYGKAIMSNEPGKNESIGLVLKMKIKRPRKVSSDSKIELLSADLIATVSGIYKFNNLGDYQYLPIIRNEDTNKTECIYHDIVPGDPKICTPQWLREKKNIPLFLPPVQFTKNNRVQILRLKETTESI